jgi:metal-sulfur cluster biosynthetic enzyme
MNDIEEVTTILRDVIDPELGLDIVSLGLVYTVEVSPGEVYVAMSTTSPMCPMGEVLLSATEQALRRRYRTRAVTVELVDEPRWQVGMMDEAARRAVGLL